MIKQDRKLGKEKDPTTVIANVITLANIFSLFLMLKESL